VTAPDKSTFTLHYVKYDGYNLEQIMIHVLAFWCFTSQLKSLFLMRILRSLHMVTRHMEKHFSLDFSNFLSSADFLGGWPP